MRIAQSLIPQGVYREVYLLLASLGGVYRVVYLHPSLPGCIGGYTSILASLGVYSGVYASQGVYQGVLLPICLPGVYQGGYYSLYASLLHPFHCWSSLPGPQA